MSRTRGNKRRMRGVVTSDKGAKTITVRVARQYAHPVYGKIVRRESKIHVHDEKDEAHVGDLVEIEECRPMSRTKRWRLVRIVEKSPGALAAIQDVLAAEAPAPHKAEPAAGPKDR
jgi:small subunit ribosomal protein S17